MNARPLLPRSLPWLASALLALAAFPTVAEGLVLRVNDAETRPFGQLAVVLRTYEPRPMGQGQVCMRLRRPLEGVTDPLLALERAIVFGDAGDVEVTTTFMGDTQTAVVKFVSLDGSVNSSDGPLAVLFFRVAGDAPAGQTYLFEIDLADTEIFDPEGGVIPLTPRAGEIEILPPGAPMSLEADGDAIPAGTTLLTGVASLESQPIAAGQVGLRFDPALAGGPAVVTMDPRYGSSTFTVDDSTPGLLRVSFQSADASLNEVPGLFITVELPIAVDAPLGPSPLTIDPALTYLQAPAGAPIDLSLADGVIEVLPPSVIFADGFESGDLGAWSSVVTP